MKILQCFPFVHLALMFLLSSCAGKTDIKLYYEEAGSDEAILFIHGAQEDYRVFMPQIETLNKSYRTITYSRRYNYPNQYRFEVSKPYTVFTEAEDLYTMVNKLETDTVHLVGHSYGALIAMAFADQQPERVKSLTLSEPPLMQLPGCESWHQHAQEELIEKGKTAYETGDSTKVMSVIFEFFVGANIQDQIPPPVLEMLYANLEEMVALFHSDDPFPTLSTDPETPLLFITSGNTMPMLECTNEVFLQQNPGVTHLHLPDATHDMWITHPQELSQALNDFISGNDDSF